MKKQQPKLPDKPSALIRVALRDLEKCERSRQYRIDMSTWHRPNGQCSVCLAGAVMSQTMQVPASKKIGPYDFKNQNIRAKLFALNAFRGGFVGDGLTDMGIENPLLTQTANVTSYNRDPIQFKSDMRRLASLLSKAGL